MAGRLQGWWHRPKEKEHIEPVTCRFPKWGIALLVVLATVLADTADSGGPRPGRRPLDEPGKLHVSPEDRCPVCGMRVIRYPYFSTAIQLKDHTTYYFCSAGCMIRAWLQPEIFLARQKDQIMRIAVKNYFSGQPLDGFQATWIAGSDVVGPMGPALVPVSGPQELETFQRRHGGNRVFRLRDLDDDLWNALTGGKAGNHRP